MTQVVFVLLALFALVGIGANYRRWRRAEKDVRGVYAFGMLACAWLFMLYITAVPTGRHTAAQGVGTGAGTLVILGLYIGGLLRR